MLASLHQRLILMVFLCILPVWLGNAGILYYSYNAKRSELSDRAKDTARALRQAVETQLAGVDSALVALGASPSLRAGDFAVFHNQTRLLLKVFDGADIILAGPDGQQLVNSYKNFGDPLPRRKNADVVQAVFATGKTQLSGPFRGAVTGRYLLGLDRPVEIDGVTRFDLGMTFPVDRFGSLLKGQNLPGGWVATILSAERMVVARSDNAMALVGQSASGVVGLDQVYSDQETLLDITDLEGRRMLTAFSRSPAYNWVVAVGMPMSELDDALRRWLLLAVVFSCALTLAGFALARVNGLAIAREFGSLLRATQKLRRREPVELSGFKLREARELGAVLTETFEQVDRERALREQTQNELERHRDRLDDEVRARTAELLQANIFIANVIDSMPSLLVCVDRDMRITRINIQAAEAAGVSKEEAVGRPLRELFPDFAPSPDNISRVLIARKPESPQRQAVSHDGEIRHVDVVVYPLVTNCVDGAVVRVDDVTDRVRLELLMLQAEKMMSLGGVAAGIAHEINNPLGIIAQCVSLIQRRVSTDLPANTHAADRAGIELDALTRYLTERGVLASLADIHEATARAAKIVRSMLSFSRSEETAMQDCDLAGVVESAVAGVRGDYQLARLGWLDGVSLRVEHEDADTVAHCSESQMQQVFVNILRNAVQALATQQDKRRPREIAVKTWRKGDMVNVSLRDNGPGIPTSVASRVFEPFFTTKGPKEGTGLGLSISYFIVSRVHGGSIDVVSSPEEGTTFTVSLPAARPESQEAARAG